MKKLVFIIAIIFQIISIVHAQTDQAGQFPAGLIYGPKGAYRIDAPENWVLDNTSGTSMGLPCVLYITGSTWQNSPVIMYAKIASTNFESIDTFINFAIKEFKKEDSTFYYKEHRKGEIENNKYTIMDYRGGLYNSFERVFYIQMEHAVGYVVFSARTEEDFKKYSDAIFEIIKSYEYKPEYIGYNEK